MPSVLVESMFLTNPVEAELLRDEEFREAVAQGIAEGIEAYLSGNAEKGGLREP
jgi:N-acetylmuramoyl-L-alanine amidase